MCFYPSYWLAKSTLAVPFTIVLGTFYAVVVYFMSGMQTQNFGLFLATILLNYEAATSIGFFLSAGVRQAFCPLSLCFRYELNRLQSASDCAVAGSRAAHSDAALWWLFRRSWHYSCLSGLVQLRDLFAVILFLIVVFQSI